MARRIEFIAPVSAIRGNLSGSQDLRYPNNVKAWYSQGGYAQNYTPRYIGFKRNGKAFYSIKQTAKASVTSSSMMAMAAFGGTAAVVNAITHDASHIATIVQLFREQSSKGTLRAYITQFVYPALVDKTAIITITNGSATSVVYNNPWVSGGSGSTITIDSAIITKFNPYLAS